MYNEKQYGNGYTMKNMGVQKDGDCWVVVSVAIDILFLFEDAVKIVFPFPLSINKVIDE